MAVWRRCLGDASSRSARLRLLASALVGLIATSLSACGAGQAARTPSPAGQGLVALPAAVDFVVGSNRFPFGLLTQGGELIEGAAVEGQFFRIGENGNDLAGGEFTAHYRGVKSESNHVHASGELHVHLDVTGVYVVDGAAFDAPGFWEARMVASGAGLAAPAEARLAFEVRARSTTVAPGERVPASRNPTARDITDLAEITTLEPPVPGLYQLTVEEALRLGRPLVVAFATPAFCVTRMCGPVTDVVASLYERYGDRVSFIHIEPWDLKVARSEGRLAPTAITLEWRLPTEPWVFVVDADGLLSARFEGLVTEEELEAAIKAVLG